MAQLFISYVQEDSSIAQEITEGLESSGYSTWYYERDSIPGPSYLLQMGEAIDDADAVVLIISPSSILSNQVTSEVIRGHENNKPFIPLLHGISHEEFQKRAPIWRQVLGASTAIGIGEDLSLALRKIADGLNAFGIEPVEQLRNRLSRKERPEMTGSAAEAKVRVLLVEDEDLFRNLLKIALSQHERFEVVGDFSDGESALDAAQSLQPDVALLDIELRSKMNGIQVGLQLRQQLPNLGIVLLSNHGDPNFISSLPPDVIEGWSYLLKKSVRDMSALARAIDGAVAGFVVVDPQILSGMRHRPEGVLARLTPRQREILDLIVQGHNNAAIAQQLVLSEKSVENQINIIYQQLEVRKEASSTHPRVTAVLTYLRESQSGI